MTIYYVSSEIGSDNNAGTSAAAPLASLQAAANIVKPGDTVQVMNGTYSAPAYGAALDITTSGSANAPITFEAAPGQTPVIDSTGGWNAIDIQASYIVVSGFTVVGGAANYNLQSALAGYSTGNASLDGNGIVVNPSSSVSLPNHITIENNTVSNEPGGGIGLDGADYVQILNNVVHNNANWSAYGTSGITINSSVNLDTNAGPHDIVSGNIVYDNAQLVPSSGVGAITDGEGIILDTNPGYTGGILVQNNTVSGNGGPGIESFLTDNATITGNTIYGNNTQNIQSQNNAEIFINQSSNNTVINNLFQSGSGVHPNDLALSGSVTGALNFIDTLNFVASYGDLINAFGTNQQAAQNWYTTREPIEQRVETFDGLDYVASYGDLINAFKSAGSKQAVLDAGATHYIDYGYNEGRTTTFNGLDYIASYGDLINAFGANSDAGAYHYIENGASEGRTTTFDGLDYIASYGDLIKAFGANEQAGAEHFIDNGQKEGRTTTFDGLDYIANYTDLMKAYGANNDAGATHYIDNGFSEHRSTSFNVGAYESAHPDLIGKFSSNDAFLTAYINTYKATGTFLT
jgi:parallel beta-helix repeat protein